MFIWTLLLSTLPRHRADAVRTTRSHKLCALLRHRVDAVRTTRSHKLRTLPRHRAGVVRTTSSHKATIFSFTKTVFIYFQQNGCKLIIWSLIACTYVHVYNILNGLESTVISDCSFVVII